MRVICCHNNNIRPETEKAITKYAPECEYVFTEGIWGYNNVIASRWDGSSDLIVIEQDKVINESVMPMFENCGGDWCSFRYYVYPPPYTQETWIGLGCVKYSAKAQQMVKPEKFLCEDLKFQRTCPDCNGKGCWRYLDSRIGYALMAYNIFNCTHGRIRHLHEYSADWAKQIGLD